MAMRDLVSGGAACAVPGSSSPANPLGALANALIGSSSKTNERLQEIPSAASSSSFDHQQLNHQLPLPGSEEDLLRRPPDFISSFRQNAALDEAWNDVLHPPPAAQFHRPPALEEGGPPQRVLSNFLHSFVHSAHGGVPFRPGPLPMLGLSEGDKHCIRDRSAIMARHIFADKGHDFIDAQLNALFSSLDIDASSARHHPGHHHALDQYWNESQGLRQNPDHHAWVSEFNAPPQQLADDWVHDFNRHHAAATNPNAWASEFERTQLSSVEAQIPGAPNVATLAAMDQSRMLAKTLSQNNDPKFQNSKFLQFVSKMSRGELSLDGTADWANEYQQQHKPPPSWANEFMAQGTESWVNEFSSGKEMRASTSGDQWVDEFSNLHINDWADEFGKQVGEGAFGETSTETWANAYDEYLNEQVAAKQRSDSSRGVYEFSDMNPYVGHPNPLKEGQELFRKGLLSEAVLALEAEVLKNPENAEGWRLLGIAHAENDDDQQAIAAMMRAQEADPTNLEVLLALGVSHTNELEQASALKYLYGWLRNHPKYGTLAPPELADSLYYADVARLFNDAAQISPEDADVHIVLGVLYNLSREYDKAIESFQTALKLKPHDYSLWNKLGATQANSVQSADAIYAYQQALDLKPNYVRAWANMGISYANQGMHEDSIRYYVRALAMNPKADNAWQYLRISLSCADRSDMLEACDSRNLDVLQKEFPL